MAITRGPNIVRDGLVLCLDAKDPNSYPGSGSTWYDLSGNNFDYTLGANLTYNSSNKTFTLSNTGGGGAGATTNNAISTSTSCTLVLWIKSTETQALFWGSNSTYYVGAYNSINKEYYPTNVGSPDYYQDLVEKANIYDHFRDGNWHMVEFKNVNFSTWTSANHYFNSYGSFEFGNGECGQILMYDKVLSSNESSQNYNSFKSRFGL